MEPNRQCQCTCAYCGFDMRHGRAYLSATNDPVCNHRPNCEARQLYRTWATPAPDALPEITERWSDPGYRIWVRAFWFLLGMAATHVHLLPT